MRIFIAAFFALALTPASARAAGAAGDRPAAAAEAILTLPANPEGERLAASLPRTVEAGAAQMADAFVDSWHYYLWRVEQGDSLTDLEYLLACIKEKYAGAGLKLSAVDRELAAVRSLRKLAAEQPVGGE